MSTPKSAPIDALEGQDATFRYFVDALHALELKCLRMENRALLAELWIRLYNPINEEE